MTSTNMSAMLEPGIRCLISEAIAKELAQYLMSIIDPIIAKESAKIASHITGIIKETTR